MEIIGKLLWAKELTIQPVACWIIHTSKKNYKLIVINLSKQQVFDGDPRVKEKINFTGILESYNDNDKTQIIFILEKVKETILGFSQGTVKVL